MSENTPPNRQFSDESRDNTTNGPKCIYWVRHDYREFITDPNGEIVNLARLTAYAEHGERIHSAQAHHEIPLRKINAPAFIDALTPEEHGRLHASGLKPVEVDGIPRLRHEAEADW